VLAVGDAFKPSTLQSKRYSSSRGLFMIQTVKPGSVVALVTPMLADNSIDYPKLEELLKWHVASGS
jgi:hypothetical protein